MLGTVYVPHDASVVVFASLEPGGAMYSVMLSSCISCRRVRRSETDSMMAKNGSEETGGGEVFNISTRSSSSVESLLPGCAACRTKSTHRPSLAEIPGAGAAMEKRAVVVC